MLTKLTIRNFKRFTNVEIELGNPVVFIGPNDSGKTTALQALALWDIGLKRWNEKRAGKVAPQKRPGVTINRRDLLAVPVPDANLLWRDLHVRDVSVNGGKQLTRNVRVDVIVEGVTNNNTWGCGLEFDYANEESFYCRPLRLQEGKNPGRMPIPDEAGNINLAFLQPMSGLAARETRLDPGAINVCLGEGRTAEVLRNLCYQLASGSNGQPRWLDVRDQIERLFGVSLDPPQYIAERGELVMTYRTPSGVRLDLSAAGRGLQQTLLLLTHLAVNPRSVLLLDEPDAHLEILRQRQIYQILTEAARRYGSQVIAASHSEVILNEAADRDVVVAFVGTPHRIDDRGSQVLKALKEVGFDQYYQAEQTGFVLYLEGSTDLAILRAFAETLGHRAKSILERPFVHYIQNHLPKARSHFRALREAKNDLVGFVLCDRTDQQLQSTPDLQEYAWKRKEIENYLCQPGTLLAFARASAEDLTAGPLFADSDRKRMADVMRQCIEDLVPPVAMRDPNHSWWRETKASDTFLAPLFESYYEKLNCPSFTRKSDFHTLARFVPKDELDPEVEQVLDAIWQVSQKAKPAVDRPA